MLPVTTKFEHENDEAKLLQNLLNILLKLALNLYMCFLSMIIGYINYIINIFHFLNLKKININCTQSKTKIRGRQPLRISC